MGPVISRVILGPAAGAAPAEAGRQAATTPAPAPVVTPDLEMQEPSTPEASSTTRDGSPDNASAEGQFGFIYADDTRKFPVGWPRLAAEQNYVHNGSTHRRHGYLFQRCMNYQGSRLAWLEKELLEQEEREAQEQNEGGDRTASGLKSLLPGQKRPIGEELQDPDTKEFFIERLSESLIRYAQLLLCDAELRKLPSVSMGAHWSAYKTYTLDNNMLDEEAKLFFQRPNDFITTQTDRIHNPLEWLIYGRPDSFIVKLISNTWKSGDRNTSFKRSVSTTTIKAVVTVGIVAASGALLLSPVAILYIAQLTKSQSICVVVVFATVFTTSMSFIHGMKADTIFLGLSAYLAVLATFLANTQGACQCG